MFLAIFLLVSLETFCQKTIQKDSSTLIIEKFTTRIRSKDSSWNITTPIYISTQPALLTINFKDKKDTINPSFICVFTEPVTIRDTLKLGKSTMINFNNLAGGDYTLTFINLNNNQKSVIKFSVAFVFWQKWWFAPFVFLVISIILGLIFYFFYLIRLRQQLRLQAVRHELEIKALRAQMNPHFIFNSMNTIDAYILRKRFIEASDCLQKFSKLIRQILENSENQTISIAQELETLKLYIELEQERFSHSFSYQFDIQPELLEKDYQIPPLLIQPFVENAILHGIRHLTERKGEILLNLSITDSLLLCIITDNGIGRKASSEINKQRQENHKSMGVDITMERISGYQALYGDKMKTNITDLEEGTKIEIKLPLTPSP